VSEANLKGHKKLERWTHSTVRALMGENSNTCTVGEERSCEWALRLEEKVARTKIVPHWVQPKVTLQNEYIFVNGGDGGEHLTGHSPLTCNAVGQAWNPRTEGAPNEYVLLRPASRSVEM